MKNDNEIYVYYENDNEIYSKYTMYIYEEWQWNLFQKQNVYYEDWQWNLFQLHKV
jgi:hypothetical protein